MLKTIVMIGIIRIVATIRRRDQVLNRVDSEGRERVDLLGDAHGAELGGHAGARARGDHQRREHGRQLLGQREPDGRADEALLIEDAQRRDRLLRGDGAREESDQQNDGKRPDAHELHLLEEQPQAERGPHQPHCALAPS